MDLKIFDVEHGACALLEADNYSRAMIDCGHNSATNWRPGTYLRSQGIRTLERLAITNYDEDHVSGAVDLFSNINVQWLWRNMSVSASDLRMLKSEDGIGNGINELCHQLTHTFNGSGDASTPEATFAGLTDWQTFCNRYPSFDDENNLSMAVFFRCHGVGIIFTGDLEKAGFSSLLNNNEFIRCLANTNIYVASHHGRENGCSDEVAALLQSVFFVIISDKGYAHTTQETHAFYRRIAQGGYFRGEKRHVLTTRHDGRIGFNFAPGRWGPY